VASPKAYDSLAGSLTMAGEDAVLQVGDSLKRLHLDVIKNPNDIIRAGKAFDARTSMTLSAWNKKWQAWAGDDLAEAYLRGAEHADAEIELLGLRKGDGTITSGTTLAGKDAAGAIARSVPNSVKASFSSAGLRHHLTFYNTFRNAAFSTLEKTSLQILRSAQDLHRNVAIMAGESMFKEADIFTRRALSQKMLDDYAQRGVTSIVYKNGARVSIDSYAEMVGRTMSAHAATQASLNRYTEYGYDLVRVTAHFQACDLCIPWEGQVLSKSGSHPHYNSLDDAIRNGLFHPNCQHDLNPYFPGVSPDKLDVRVDPEVQKLIDQHGYTAAQRMTYQAEQQQRYIERQIKTWKRREMVSLDSSAQRKAHQKVLDWQSRQRTHINDNPFLRRKYERETVKGWYEKVRSTTRAPVFKSVRKPAPKWQTKHTVPKNYSEGVIRDPYTLLQAEYERLGISVEKKIDKEWILSSSDRVEKLYQVNSVSAFTQSKYTYVRNTPGSIEAQRIEAFIKDSPSWKGKLYRGVKADASQLNVGDVIDMRGISSWTSEERIAQKFAYVTEKDKYGIIFELSGEVNHTTSIAHLARFGSEQEVIMSGQATMKVKSISGHKVILEVIQ